VHSLLAAVRPDRQTLLFSATLPRKIEALVGRALNNPVRISVGLLGAANADVAQRVEVLAGRWMDWWACVQGTGWLPHFTTCVVSL
jgi:ATP-dependent RNA helicase DDX42